MPLQPTVRSDQPGTLALIDDACARVDDALSKLTELQSIIQQSRETLGGWKQPGARRSDSATLGL
jgi:hypothetical protein